MDFAHLRTCPCFLWFLPVWKVWWWSMHYFLSYCADTTQTHTHRRKRRKHNLHQEILGGDKKWTQWKGKNKKELFSFKTEKLIAEIYIYLHQEFLGGDYVFGFSVCVCVCRGVCVCVCQHDNSKNNAWILIKLFSHVETLKKLGRIWRWAKSIN